MSIRGNVQRGLERRRDLVTVNLADLFQLGLRVESI